ncbi:natural cytotoxicity triggering receptor 3 ligand 1 [Acomys russatus]|uniref:natural cytotoxicity triggering receptor 3 ligand 1 n=1 Tax=Acomys russatus TaxID=60746 RepID=UPI0021E335CF|nr:natural cytotoxicity triggering receptor 3 ligand 1 [Acomys russatus]
MAILTLDDFPGASTPCLCSTCPQPAGVKIKAVLISLVPRVYTLHPSDWLPRASHNSSFIATGGLDVETTGRTQVAFLYDNVTIACKIPGSPQLDIKTVGIIWFCKNASAESEAKVFEFYGNHQVAFRPGAMVSLSGLKSGDASLHLPGVQLWEAGEYRCKLVVTPEKAEGTTMLEVVANPTIRLFVKPAAVSHNEERHIVCELYGFYPEAVSIRWERGTPKDSHFQEMTGSNVTGPTVKNKDGTFNVTSCLTVKPALEDDGTVYQCVVLHKSLLVPQRLNVTLPEKGSVDMYFYILIPCVLVIPTAFLFFLWKR